MQVTNDDVAKIGAALGADAHRLMFFPAVDGNGEQLGHGTLKVPDDLAAAVAALDLTKLSAIPRDAYRAECARRIEAIASDATQRNMSAYFALLGLKGTLSSAEEAQVAAFQGAVQWIASMRSTWRALADAGDPDYTADAKWPAVPAAAAALAAQF